MVLAGTLKVPHFALPSVPTSMKSPVSSILAWFTLGARGLQTLLAEWLRSESSPAVVSCSRELDGTSTGASELLLAYQATVFSGILSNQMARRVRVHRLVFF